MQLHAVHAPPGTAPSRSPAIGIKEIRHFIATLLDKFPNQWSSPSRLGVTVYSTVKNKNNVRQNH